jgi:hypothetical protein
MAIDDYEIDLDDGALAGHADNDVVHETPLKPFGSDDSVYGSAGHHGGDYEHGRSSHRSGASHTDNSDDSHGGKRSHGSRDSHDGKRSHDSEDAKHVQKAKRSHDSDDAEHSQRTKHSREAKHDDPRASHKAKRSHDADDTDHSQKVKGRHDSDDAETSQRTKRSREDKHSDDSHEVKRSHHSGDAEHFAKERHSNDSHDSGRSDESARPKDRHGSHSPGSKDSHDLGISRQIDRTAYDTANRTRAPRGPSGDVADDLITAAYGTGTGHLGTAAASQPSFPRADTSDLVKGTPSAGDEQPDVLRQDTPPTLDPTAVPRRYDPYPTSVDTNVGAAAPGPVANTPAQVPPVTVAPPPPAPVSAPPPPPVFAPAPPQSVAQPPVEVVATDANGAPTHVRISQPVNTTTMVTMGGNNPGYVNGQSVVGYKDDHVVSSVPINPPQTIVTFDGNLRTGPGGEIDRGPVNPQNLGPSGSSSASAPGGGATQPLPPKPGYPTSDGMVFPTVGEQHRHEEALRNQQIPYESPTVRRGP